MKNFITLTAILLIVSTQSYSQKNRDALFLKNGSEIFGKMEQVTGGRVSVRTPDGSLFVFDSTEVDHFVIHDNSAVTRKVQGFGFGAEAGLLVGSQNSRYPAPFSLAVHGTYTFATKYSAEAGTGIEIIGNTYAPLYGGFRVCLNNNRTAPYIFARAGYMAVISSGDNVISYYPVWSSFYPVNYYYTDDRKYKGGPSATAGFGISVAARDVEINMSFAYRYFQTKEIVTTSTETTENFYYNYNRLEIKLGLRF
jgi:hypothetical protein